MLNIWSANNTCTVTALAIDWGCGCVDHIFVYAYTVRPRVNCLPLWKEACLQSEFIDVKTIRVLTPEHIEEFVHRNTDVHIVHLVCLHCDHGLTLRANSESSIPFSHSCR